MKYGYTRTSTKDKQDDDLQRRALVDATSKSSWMLQVAATLENTPLTERYAAWLENRTRHTDPLFRLREYQAGHCALCRSARQLVVDHDHESGLVRGLLCRSCNTKEGKYLEAPWFEVYRADPPAARLGLEIQYGQHRPAAVPGGPPGASFAERFSAAIYLGLYAWPAAKEGVDAAGWEGLGALYYKLGAAVLVWDAERCEERLAAQIADASETSDSGAPSEQGGDPK